MRSALSIMIITKAKLLLLSTFIVSAAAAQDNSPYSRYGLGDIVPSTNIVNRGFGGVSAAYSDFLSINFANPASYSGFQGITEAQGNKLASGRVLLDVGVNLESRTLRSPNQVAKFTSSNALFSYLQVGVPLRKNWGLSFGLRPLTRIGYKITQSERIKDAATGLPLDSAFTEYSGDGGSYLPSIGTGFRIKDVSFGANMGYLFGRRETARKRGLINDSIQYNNSNQTTNSYFGDLFFNAGIQYKIDLNKENQLRLGVAGNVKQSLKGRQDFVAETFSRTADAGDFQLDSVFKQTDVPGEVVYPASVTAGFIYDHNKDMPNAQSWSVGLDFSHNKWEDYRFFGAKDAVQNNWQVKAGGQYRPKPGRNYFSNVAYRAGFTAGPDYIIAGGNMPQFGASLGLGLPLANYNRLAPNQYTIINLALEYGKRGNNDNPIKENTFRLSLGLNFSDVWFVKRKYD